MRALDLARALIRCPSVTPADAGATAVLSDALEPLGFECTVLRFEEEGFDPVDNLYATRAAPGDGRHFCFAGHTDVVPVGDPAGWTVDPFGARVIDGDLYGRGAADMKGGIACFVAAAALFLERRPGFDERISLLITGDEEKDAVNGTVKMLDWAAGRGIGFDACLVGEPTNPHALGDMMKIGRRGSVSARLTVRGRQGHVAYPGRNDNPVPRLIRTLGALIEHRLDRGSERFEPSNLEVTTIDVGNDAGNMVPSSATAAFNIRFNDRHTGAGLEEWIRRTVTDHAGDHELTVRVSGESFLSPPGRLAGLIADASAAVTGRRPEMSTSGGTSDARFIRRYCEVAEFGLVGRTMHKVDERVAVADLEKLTAIYLRVLEGFFAREDRP